MVSAARIAAVLLLLSAAPAAHAEPAAKAAPSPAAQGAPSAAGTDAERRCFKTAKGFRCNDVPDEKN